jgi:uncharacterized protein
MSLEYPDAIDPRKAAEGHRTFSGSMAMNRMERLKPFLADDRGEARFTAAFEKDSLVGVSIQVEVDAALWLICQRSLEPYQEVIHRSSLLGVIENLEDESLLPEGYEAILAEHGKVSFLAMVEDELLLALPQVPRKPGLPQPGAEADEQGVMSTASMHEAEKQIRQHPFAGLADQLKEFSSKGRNRPGSGSD